MLAPRPIVRGFAFIATVGTLTACGHDSTGPKATLTSAEAQQVSLGLFSEIGRAYATRTMSGAALGGSSAVAASPTTHSGTINAKCLAGGTVTGTIAITSTLDTAGTGLESMTMSVAIAGCEVDDGEKTIALDGNMTFGFDAGLTKYSGTYVWTGTGAFTWEGGNCSFDYAFTETHDQHGSETGTFCGSTVSYTF
jgi:hypothetical protein